MSDPISAGYRGTGILDHNNLGKKSRTAQPLWPNPSRLAGVQGCGDDGDMASYN
eukprot:CAMPEP_0179145804 /NCGR_PEP_ID=MMETSP0796-20121207/70371_1 /TAXON_ID=73915 /ORGANISM="Pyrodinium bahamense, Strain pbaha01" /LENGTH=53 /DNA_ID=CAMNT_0020846231 /DNA_START=74 /DNA_END=232 /DNA_ORIENTATION=+